MEGDSDLRRGERQRKVDELLVYSRKANTNFSRRYTKDLAMKRRTIARFQKDQKTLKSLLSHLGQDVTTSH